MVATANSADANLLSVTATRPMPAKASEVRGRDRSAAGWPMETGHDCHRKAQCLERPDASVARYGPGRQSGLHDGNEKPDLPFRQQYQRVGGPGCGHEHGHEHGHGLALIRGASRATNPWTARRMRERPSRFPRRGGLLSVALGQGAAFIAGDSRSVGRSSNYGRWFMRRFIVPASNEPRGAPGRGGLTKRQFLELSLSWRSLLRRAFCRSWARPPATVTAKNSTSNSREMRMIANITTGTLLKRDRNPGPARHGHAGLIIIHEPSLIGHLKEADGRSSAKCPRPIGIGTGRMADHPEMVVRPVSATRPLFEELRLLIHVLPGGSRAQRAFPDQRKRGRLSLGETGVEPMAVEFTVADSGLQTGLRLHVGISSVAALARSEPWRI